MAGHLACLLCLVAVAAIDGAGNASAQSSSAGATAQASPVRTTTYAYDSLDRVTTISPAGGTASAFGFDALGRHATRTTGALTETYAYAGSSGTAVRISGGASPVDECTWLTSTHPGNRMDVC